MKYPDDFINRIICGDCLEVMKGMPDNCIDTIITDPPYGIKFMGKKWDYKVPSIEVWQECLRVLKPGGTALIFAGSRTQHRMAVNVEDAGFILKDVIEKLYEPDTQAFYKKLNNDLRKEFLKLMGGNEMFWLYGSGFPKATDISQTLDKDGCRKQLEKKLGRKPTKEEFKRKWESFRKFQDYKKDISHVERGDSNIDIQKYKASGSPFKSNLEKHLNIDKFPATLEAKLWDGWKSHGLKPAYEPILVAMKPNEGSYANNAMKWGVAGLNIDGGRIGYESDNDFNKSARFGHSKKISTGHIFNENPPMHAEPNSQGRFPANVILDEEAGVMLDKQSGIKNSHGGGTQNPHSRNNWFGKSDNRIIPKGDTGGASRFFYCAKASKAERNRGCDELGEKIQKTLIGNSPMCPDCGLTYNGTNDHSKCSGQIINKLRKPQKNNHPTVKPLALMKYLCTLTKTPTGGIVLDPFCGSGTTLMACKETERDYIGIDNIPEYCEMARGRVNAIPELLF